MKTWEAFVEFQNAVAYGGVADVPGSGATQLSYVQPPVRGGSLVIGPGGANEVIALRAILPKGEISTLSAHAPEVDAIKAQAPWAHAYAGDMHCMPFEDEAFDYMFSSNVLEHAIAPIVALLEARRVLRLGGKAHFVLPSFEGTEGGVGPFHWYCLDERHWRELMRKTGFIVNECEIEKGGAAESAGGFYMHFRCSTTELDGPYAQLMTRMKELRAKEGP